MTAVAVAVGLLGACGGGVIVGRRVMAFVCERVADVTGHRTAGAVEAALLDPLAERFDRRRGRVILDRRRLRDRIGVDGDDAGAVFEHALDDRLLRGVVQATDVEDDGPVAVRRRRCHQRVRAKRWTASSSSSVFVCASASSPEVSAPATQ